MVNLVDGKWILLVTDEIRYKVEAALDPEEGPDKFPCTHGPKLSITVYTG